ncbi:hypothetical protein GCM10020001_053270 [Nonomuraea salmonea]
MSTPLTRFTADSLPVEVHPSEADLGRAAAERAAATIRDAVARRGTARVVIATGNSQYAFTDALREQGIPWDRVTVFHMDEYVGIAADHPASFRRWIKERIEDPFAPAAVHYIDGNAPPAPKRSAPVTRPSCVRCRSTWCAWASARTATWPSTSRTRRASTTTGGPG